MSDRTKIEWSDATWNPIGGCTRVSEECRNCYAEVMAARFSDPGQWGHGLARRVKLADGTTDHRWTGKVQLNGNLLDLPLRWKKPRRIFVNSTSDLFHEGVPDEWIDGVFAVMALCPQHVFMVLTKRAARMREYLKGACGRVADAVQPMRTDDNRVVGPLPHVEPGRRWWPLPNVWLGVSAGTQEAADERIPELLATPAAVRFVSAEPLLGPVDLTRWSGIEGDGGTMDFGLDWVITGGESGPGARPMHPQWARDIRGQCRAAGVAYFHKQNGNFLHESQDPNGLWDWEDADARGLIHMWEDGTASIRLGKNAAGRLLDGREWNEVPE